MMKTISKNILWFIASLVFLLLLWEIVFLVVKNDLLVPSLPSVFSSLFLKLGEASFWKNASRTLFRVLLSVLFSSILGWIFAAFSLKFSSFEHFLSPIISLIRSVPTMAVTLLLLIWFQPTYAPIIITIMVLFPMIYTQTVLTFQTLDQNVLKMASVYEIKSLVIFGKIIIPQMLPDTLANCGANLSFALKLMVSAEVLSQTYVSIGYLFNETKWYLEVDSMFALMLFVILLAMLFELAFSSLSKVLFRWRKVR